MIVSQQSKPKLGALDTHEQIPSKKDLLDQEREAKQLLIRRRQRFSRE